MITGPYDDIKIIGAICGTIMSLIFRPPKNMKELTRRLAFCAAAGYIFSGAAITIMKLERSQDMALASSALLAFSSWWCASPVVKNLSRGSIE